MTPSSAIAAGPRAAADLRAMWAGSPTAAAWSLVTSEDQAVGWDAGSRWLSAHDEGDVLVVVDGRIHGPTQPRSDPAAQLWERYRACGASVAAGLLGDFVVIVLDRPRRRLVVARDPLGVRPWYQASSGRNHSGASDLAAVAGLAWVDRTVNEPVAIEHLAAHAESRGETVYQGVATLRPGRTWSVEGGRHRSFDHHRWAVQPDLDVSWEEAVGRCRAALDEAVACRLAEGGMAIELSGGLDSSSVVGTAVRQGPGDVVVARLLFDTPRADERGYSDAVIRHWGISEVSARPWLPTTEEAVSLAREADRPPPDPHFTMFAGLHRRLLDCGRHSGLTGLGGDDAFVASTPAGLVLSAFQLRRRSALADLGRAILTQPRRATRDLAKPALARLAPWKHADRPRWVSERAARQADLARLLGRRPQPVSGVEAIDERVDGLVSGAVAATLEARALVGDLEGRRDSHPYLDPRFIASTYGLDPWWPGRFGHTRALQSEAYADRLPPAVVGRRSKADFSEVFWPQLLHPTVVRSVRSGPLVDRGWLDLAGFEALVADGRRGQPRAAIPLARCVGLDRWLRML